MSQMAFLAVPVADRLDQQAMFSVLTASDRPYHIECGSVSYTAACFNQLWCNALNLREEKKLTHFAMNHSDVGAAAGWIDRLADKLEETGADIISAVIPIKDGRGVTSTAMRRRSDGAKRRLTIRELYALPETFSSDDVGHDVSHLLINTGLWVCRFTDPWVEEVCFTFRDRIFRQADGKFNFIYDPEDWNFSDWAHERGLKVLATRMIPVEHVGKVVYPNSAIWGTCESDPSGWCSL